MYGARGCPRACIARQDGGRCNAACRPRADPAGVAGQEPFVELTGGMLMNQLMAWIGVALLATMLSGCLKIDQTLTLAKDGSGTLDLRYGMSEQSIAQIEAMEQLSKSMGGTGGDVSVEQENDSPFDFDEARVRKGFEQDNPEGVELVSLSSEVVDGWKYIQIALRFDDLEALRRTDLFEDSDLSITEDADGNYVLTQVAGADGSGVGGEGVDMDPAMMQQMAAIFAGMRIATNVIVPGRVIESNATSVEGNRASWVFDVDKDPSVLSKLGNLDMRLVFSGEDVDLPRRVSNAQD